MVEVFIKDYLVTIPMVDTKQNIKLSALENILTDCAGFHSEQMGLGIIDVQKLNITWVLSKVRFKINKLPTVLQHVMVKTWLVNVSKYAFIRDFVVLNDDGDILVKATSKWCLIDIINRQPVLLSNIKFDYVINKTYPNNFDPLFLNFTNFDKYSNSVDYKINYSDLDFNGHVNNAKYFDIILNCVGKDVAEKLVIEDLQIQFINELLYNENAVVFFEKINNQWFFCGKNVNGDLCFLVNINEKTD